MSWADLERHGGRELVEQMTTLMRVFGYGDMAPPIAASAVAANRSRSSASSTVALADTPEMCPRGVLEARQLPPVILAGLQGLRQIGLAA